MRKVDYKTRDYMFGMEEDGKKRISSNTVVIKENGLVSVYLFGNHIATYSPSRKMLKISSAGYHTRTTKNRLSGLLCSPRTMFQFVYIRKGVLTFEDINGKVVLVEGYWHEINETEEAVEEPFFEYAKH